MALWFSDKAAAVARYGPIGDWDTRDVKSMRKLFEDRAGFDEDIGRWNVGGVEDMGSMFDNAHSFNQPLDKWTVSSVKNMDGMFFSATSFNQPLDKWDVSNVKTMRNMFYNAAKFNQPLGKWDVRNVNDMWCMFQKAASFDQPLDKWDVSSVKTMGNMFDGSRSFQQPATLERFGLVLPSPSRALAPTHAVRPHRQSRMLTTDPPARTVVAQTCRGLQCCITLCAHSARQRGHPPPGTRAPAHTCEPSSGRRARALPS